MFRFGFRALVLLVAVLPRLVAAGLSVPDGLTRENAALPGGSYEGVVTVLNTGDRAEDVKVYQTDYVFHHDGRNLYDEPGSNPRSNAPWISYTPSRATIPAGESMTISYRVRVPADAQGEGTRWSLLMVEAIPDSSPESTRARPDEVRLGITQVFRFGVQIVTNVGEQAKSDLRFLGTRLAKGADERTLEVDVENIGESFLRLQLWTELYDEAGRSLGRFDGGRYRTYPGTSVRFRVDLSGVPAGTYKALVVADGGGDNVFGASYTLSLRQ